MKNPLVCLMKKRIEAYTSRLMPFDRWMEMALYEPELGYYMKKGCIESDFKTVPMLSGVLAQALADQWMRNHHPDESILELGAGLGDLAFHVLFYLEQHQALPKQYFILEISPWLQAKQKIKLAPYIDRIVWVDACPQLHRPMVIANEFFDALPVQRFEYDQGVVYPLGVGWDESGFIEKRMPYQATLDEEIRFSIDLDILPSGYRSEWHHAHRQWTHHLADRLHQCTLWIIDYGWTQDQYYAPHRKEGTLMAYQNHQAYSNVYASPGYRDITAFVNWDILSHENFECIEWKSQSEFLAESILVRQKNHSDSSFLSETIDHSIPLKYILTAMPHFSVFAFQNNTPIINKSENF